MNSWPFFFVGLTVSIKVCHLAVPPGAEMSIRLPSHLYRNRHGTFYFRFVIPKDLQGHAKQSELRLPMTTVRSLPRHRAATWDSDMTPKRPKHNRFSRLSLSLPVCQIRAMPNGVPEEAIGDAPAESFVQNPVNIRQSLQKGSYSPTCTSPTHPEYLAPRQKFPCPQGLYPSANAVGFSFVARTMSEK